MQRRRHRNERPQRAEELSGRTGPGAAAKTNYKEEAATTTGSPCQNPVPILSQRAHNSAPVQTHLVLGPSQITVSGFVHFWASVPQFPKTLGPRGFFLSQVKKAKKFANPVSTITQTGAIAMLSEVKSRKISPRRSRRANWDRPTTPEKAYRAATKNDTNFQYPS